MIINIKLEEGVDIRSIFADIANSIEERCAVAGSGSEYYWEMKEKLPYTLFDKKAEEIVIGWKIPPHYGFISSCDVMIADGCMSLVVRVGGVAKDLGCKEIQGGQNDKNQDRNR